MKNKYSMISGGEDHFQNYKEVIEIISKGDLDWKKICIELAKERPDIFIQYVSKPEKLKKEWEDLVKEISRKNPGNKILCIKKCREYSGFDLANAKNWVEENCDEYK